MRCLCATIVVLAITLGGCAAPRNAAPTTPPAASAPAPATQPPPARQDLVVVIPAKSGKSGTVTVEGTGFQIVLNGAYAAARSSPDGSIQRDTASEQEVREVFGAALAAQPPRPVSITVYFASGRNELTPRSKRELDRVREEMTRRPAPEITVTGHTDLVGADQANDALSRQRAERVKALLVRMGIPGDRIQTAGRGKREPLIPTADGVAEPRNRRVEISIH